MAVADRRATQRLMRDLMKLDKEPARLKRLKREIIKTKKTDSNLQSVDQAAQSQIWRWCQTCSQKRGGPPCKDRDLSEKRRNLGITSDGRSEIAGAPSDSFANYGLAEPPSLPFQMQINTPVLRAFVLHLADTHRANFASARHVGSTARL